MAPHSSTFAWKISWMEEPGRLQSMGSLKVGYDWASSLSLSCIGERSGNPLQCSCLENPRDGGAWWAAIYGVTQSRTWLKWHHGPNIAGSYVILFFTALDFTSITSHIGCLVNIYWLFTLYQVWTNHFTYSITLFLRINLKGLYTLLLFIDEGIET